jgi:hypothetical protein
MQLVQLIIPAEAAHDTVSQLGEVRIPSPATTARQRCRALQSAHRALRPGDAVATRLERPAPSRRGRSAVGRFCCPSDSGRTAEGGQWLNGRLFVLTPPAVALSQAGLIQFKDLNADKSAFQRTYANQVRACPLGGFRARALASAGPWAARGLPPPPRPFRGLTRLRRRPRAAAP